MIALSFFPLQIVLCLIFPDILKPQLFHLQVSIGAHNYFCTESWGRLVKDYYLLFLLYDILKNVCLKNVKLRLFAFSEHY